MIGFHSDFPFNGTRDYVHGPTLFEIFRAQVLNEVNGTEDTPFEFAYFRINRPVLSNGRVMLCKADETEARQSAGTPIAELSCTADGHRFFVGLYDEKPTPVRHRRASREKTFVGPVTLEKPLAGIAELRGIKNNNDLFQAVVEANKQIHLQTVTGDPLSKDVRFRFAYCLNYTCPSTRDLKENGRVAVRVIGTREAGGHFFSLSQMKLEMGDFRSSFKLCFASQDLVGYAHEI